MAVFCGLMSLLYVPTIVLSAGGGGVDAENLDAFSLAIVSVGNLGSAVIPTKGATTGTAALKSHNETIPVFGTAGIAAGDAAYIICGMDTAFSLFVVVFTYFLSMKLKRMVSLSFRQTIVRTIAFQAMN